VDANQLVNQLAENNIRISGMGEGKLRIVTHLDYTDDKHETVLRTLKTIHS
jgi:threonine aldolase